MRGSESEKCSRRYADLKARVCAWRHRPLSYRQWRDLVSLAHLCHQHRLSLGSYGRPRLTEGPKELGLPDQSRVGRLMRLHGIRIVCSRNFKRTTSSDEAVNLAPNLLQQDFLASGPNQKRQMTAPISERARVGPIWPSSLICFHGA